MWLGSGDRGGDRPAVSLFRRDLHVESPPAEAVVHVTADTRYRCWVNGRLAAEGPAKGSLTEWFVDPVDLAPLLVPGANVLAIEVLRVPPGYHGALSLTRSAFPGLRVEGHVVGEDVGTAVPGWVGRPDPRRTFDRGRFAWFAGLQEDAHGVAELEEWRSAGFDAGDWEPVAGIPAVVGPEPLAPWRLAPRTIPHLRRQPLTFTGASARGNGPVDAVDLDRLRARRSVVVAPGRQVTVDLDVGELTTAHPALALIGGAGASIELLAAECYEPGPVDEPSKRSKGLRTDASGDLFGDPDRYRVAGHGTAGRPEVFETWWFRAFRYLRLTITTAGEPLELAAGGTVVHYPLDVVAEVHTDDPLHERLWEVSERTLRLCMRETFEDCPHYEQLQYAMDARSQALYALLISGDDRLVRKAIGDLARSIGAEGLTASRSPSVSRQEIPTFSLFWIAMIADHARYVGDRELVAEHAGQVAGVLRWFRARLDERGLLGPWPPDAWGFVDWTPEWRAFHGAPGPGDGSAGVIPTLIFAWALRRAAELADVTDRIEEAGEYRRAAALVAGAVREHAVGDDGLVADFAGQPARSVHAQVWAVLAGVVEPTDAGRLLDTAMRRDLVAPSYAMTQYVVEALGVAGVPEAVDWSPWRRMLDLGLTTWMEDPVSQRSDCHAWGSVPLFHLVEQVLGVRPAAAGYGAIEVAPAYRVCGRAAGRAPTPHGEVAVEWRTAEEAFVRVTAPVGIPLSVRLPDGGTSTTRSGSVEWRS